MKRLFVLWTTAVSLFLIISLSWSSLDLESQGEVLRGEALRLWERTILRPDPLTPVRRRKEQRYAYEKVLAKTKRAHKAAGRSFAAGTVEDSSKSQEKWTRMHRTNLQC